MFICFNKNSSIGTKSQSCSNLFLTNCRTDRHCYHLFSSTCFFHSYSFLYCNFTKWINRHFRISYIYTGVVRLHSDFDISVYDTLNTNKNLHGFSNLIVIIGCWKGGRKLFSQPKKRGLMMPFLPN